MGLVPGNRVLLRGPNNPWLVASWFGVVKAGGVAVATMPLFRKNELETIMEIPGVTMAICHHPFIQHLDPAAPNGFQAFPSVVAHQDAPINASPPTPPPS